METMNLNNLATSLPTSNLANAEADLVDNFRAAAMSITTLYRSSKRTSKRAYNAGYAAACQDLLLMIQQGVSAGETSDVEGGSVTIGRIMDYVEARLEAIKSREEEEDEDDEKDKERERDRKATAGASARPSTVNKPPASSASGGQRLRDNVSAAPMTPLSPPSLSFTSAPPRPFSPSPSPSSSPTSLRTPSLQRQSKARLLQLSNVNPKEAVISPNTSPFSFPAVLSTASVSVTDAPLAIIPPPSMSIPPTSSFGSSPLPQLPEGSGTGTKRRHATMVTESLSSDSSNVPSIPVSASSRRRTRTTRSAASGSTRDREREHSAQDQNMNQGSDAMSMDVEEDGGRERKRVARR